MIIIKVTQTSYACGHAEPLVAKNKSPGLIDKKIKLIA